MPSSRKFLIQNCSSAIVISALTKHYKYVDNLIRVVIRHTDQMDQQYKLVWNFPKKSAAKSNAERACQTTVNKDKQ